MNVKPASESVSAAATPTNSNLPPFPSATSSVSTAINMNGSKPKIDVAVLIDTNIKSVSSGSHQDHRAECLEIIKRACIKTNARVIDINFKRLDFGEASVVDQFYSSDSAIVDLSIPDQQSALFYHLGVRESFGMKNNILLFNEVSGSSTVTQASRELKSMLQSVLSSHIFLTYRVIENTEVEGGGNPIKHVIVTESSTGRIVGSGDDSIGKMPPDAKSLLYYKLRRLLQDVEVQTKAHMKEKFLSDLRKARETYTGQELANVLHNLRKRLDDPNVISNEVVHSMMLSFREIQDYDAMVQLIDDLESVANFKFTSTPAILNYYAFALNRRNRKGDREKALSAITQGLKNKENYVPDIVCLCGRIYKDMFTESGYTDKEALSQAIEWYRKGFGIQQSEYAGINLATLLVVAGGNFKESQELQRIGMILSSLIGRKGSLNTLQDYWDVAIFFEISVLADNYARAIQVSLIVLFCS
jgi:mitogen-activated protein kinase kinase kinase 5